MEITLLPLHNSWASNYKRIISAFIMLLIAALPTFAQTEYIQNGLKYTLNSEGTAIVSGYTSDLSANVDIPSKITKVNKEYTVTSIGEWAFIACKSISSVTIPNSVSKICDFAFKDCTGLTSVTMNDGIVELGWGAFENCKGIKSIEIPTSVIRIGSDAFEKIANINYSGYASGKPWGAKTVNGTIDGDFIFSDPEKTTLAAYIGEGGDVIVPYGVTVVGQNAFYGCLCMTSVKIPASVKTIGRSSFWYCSNLTSINISEGVKSIEPFAFCGCNGLLSIKIPATVINIGSHAFSSCNGLISLTVPSSVKSIGDMAFEHIPNVNYTGPCRTSTSWGAKTLNGTIDGDFVYADAEKTQLTAYIGFWTDIAIPQGVTSIGRLAFSDCNNLKNVTIPTSVTSIDYLAFANCFGLKSINIPESVTKIGKGAFMRVANVNYGGIATGSPWDAKTRNGIIQGDYVYDDVEKTQLTAYVGEDSIATIPQGVKSIGDQAFYGNKTLKKITIPKSITQIGSEAFVGCSNVVDIYCYANPTYLLWDGDGFKNDATTRCHVLASFLAKYKSKYKEVPTLYFMADL